MERWAREWTVLHPETDYFVFGHLHRAEDIDLGEGRRMIVLGDWSSGSATGKAEKVTKICYATCFAILRQKSFAGRPTISTFADPKTIFFTLRFLPVETYKEGVRDGCPLVINYLKGFR